MEREKCLILLIIRLISKDLVLWLSLYFRGTRADVFSFIKHFRGPSINGAYRYDKPEEVIDTKQSVK